MATQETFTAFDFGHFEDDEVEDRHWIVIEDSEHVQYALIPRRTRDELYPLDGEVANAKRERARLIVEALNEKVG